VKNYYWRDIRDLAGLAIFLFLLVLRCRDGEATQERDRLEQERREQAFPERWGGEKKTF